jgi:hypothetical protein
MEQSFLLQRYRLLLQRDALTSGGSCRRRLTKVLAGICLVVAAAATCSHAQEASASRSVDAFVIVHIRPIDEAEIEGRLTALDAESLAITRADGNTRSWPLSEIRSWHISRRGPTSAAAPPVVLLANDDCLHGTVEAADEDVMSVLWTAVDPPQTLSVPLEAVRSFVVRHPEDELAQIKYRRLWALSQPKIDVLYSTENAHVQGEFLGLAEGNAQLKNSLGVIRTPVTNIIAVVMNSDMVSLPYPVEPYSLVSFADGTRLSMVSLRLDEEGRLSGRTAWGNEISFPLGAVARVQFLGERVIPLMDLEPQAYTFTPYLTERHPLVINRNVKGGRLQLRGETYATGLGVASKSDVTYDLTDGGYDRFEAVVGVDDMTGGLGDVVFAVEVDGARVYESGPVSGKSSPAPVGPISVAGAGQLKLIVDFGRLGNIQDFTNWCDPVLIKPARQE